MISSMFVNYTVLGPWVHGAFKSRILRRETVQCSRKMAPNLKAVTQATIPYTLDVQGCPGTLFCSDFVLIVFFKLVGAVFLCVASETKRSLRVGFRALGYIKGVGFRGG